MKASGDSADTLTKISYNSYNQLGDKLFRVQDNNPSNKLSRNVSLQHIDYENLGGHRHESALLVEMLSKIQHTVGFS
jgi:hypothetical protein